MQKLTARRTGGNVMDIRDSENRLVATVLGSTPEVEEVFRVVLDAYPSGDIELPGLPENDKPMFLRLRPDAIRQATEREEDLAFVHKMPRIVGFDIGRGDNTGMLVYEKVDDEAGMGTWIVRESGLVQFLDGSVAELRDNRWQVIAGDSGSQAAAFISSGEAMVEVGPDHPTAMTRGLKTDLRAEDDLAFAMTIKRG